jgi:hypothetical protein
MMLGLGCRAKSPASEQFTSTDLLVSSPDVSPKEGDMSLTNTGMPSGPMALTRSRNSPLADGKCKGINGLSMNNWRMTQFFNDG